MPMHFATSSWNSAWQKRTNRPTSFRTTRSRAILQGTPVGSPTFNFCGSPVLQGTLVPKSASHLICIKNGSSAQWFVKSCLSNTFSLSWITAYPVLDVLHSCKRNFALTFRSLLLSLSLTYRTSLQSYRIQTSGCDECHSGLSFLKRRCFQQRHHRIQDLGYASIFQKRFADKASQSTLKRC